jgi:hypothetical protein
VFFFANGGNSPTVGAVFNPSAAPAAGTAFTIATLATAAGAGGPTSGRAMKSGVTIINSTNALNRAGQVYILNANQRFEVPSNPAAMTTAHWNAFIAEIKAHPDTRAHTADEFVRPRTFVTHPANEPAYHGYLTWTGTQIPEDYMRHVSTWTGTTSTSEESHRPMSTLVVILDVASADQSYTLSTRASFYTRWPVDTIMGQHMIHTPVAPQAAINAARLSAQAAGHVAR